VAWLQRPHGERELGPHRRAGDGAAVGDQSRWKVERHHRGAGGDDDLDRLPGQTARPLGKPDPEDPVQHEICLSNPRAEHVEFSRAADGNESVRERRAECTFLFSGGTVGGPEDDRLYVGPGEPEPPRRGQGVAAVSALPAHGEDAAGGEATVPGADLRGGPPSGRLHEEERGHPVLGGAAVERSDRFRSEHLQHGFHSRPDSAACQWAMTSVATSGAGRPVTSSQWTRGSARKNASWRRA